MNISSRSYKELQESLADFALRLLCNDMEFNDWWMDNVVKPATSTRYDEHEISYNKIQEFNRLLEKKLRG